jgi:PAS domain S-box-containing protein
MPDKVAEEQDRVAGGQRVARDVAHHRAHGLGRSLADGDPLAVHALLVALVESSDDAIIATDLDGTIRAWNAAAERTFGYREEEVLGLPITILIPTDRAGEEETILETLRRGERIDHFETERVRKDGRGVHVSLTLSPIRGASGAIIGAARIARDTTAARQAQEMQATLAAIVASSDDAIDGKTLDGVIMTWNASAERMFGYSSDEIVGKSITMLLPPERLSEEATIVATLRRGERIEHFETERVTKDGRRLQVSLSVSPILDPAGRIIGAAKIARDVTLRHMLERERDELYARERAAREEAETANRAKDVFLATISHELRTPLSPILAWTRMLRQGVLDEAKTAKALATIERSARSQTQLIDDLLDVSRIISGKLRLEVRPADLGAIIQAALEVVRPAADAKGIRVQAVLDTETGKIAGDPERLQQVVWNLLSNAIKFTPKGGRVQVTLERVNSHVEIAVSDTGQGFDPSFRPHMFERFWQADSSITRTHGGLGLGLSIVRHIVELHGGTVHAESPGKGQGATFTVKLPLVIFERSAGETKRRHPTSADDVQANVYQELSGARVLVVDDEPDSNEVMSTLLASRGAEVRVATSASDALDTMRVWRPDLVVSDIGMPGEDGYALLAAMRANERELGRIPAIALTAYATRNDRIRILGAGFQLHVTKPIDPVELIASVANVLTVLGKL